MLSRLGIIITLALALLLFLWLGPQQSLSNTPAGSTSPSGTNGAVALNPSDTKHSTPNPGQAKKATPTPTPTPIPTASPTPTATPKPTVTPTPTPTATPAPTPTPTPSAGTLTWRPPACGDATHTCATLQLSNTGSHQYLRLDSSKDWIVNLPTVPLVGGIDIDGGHSVIIIGGEIDLPLNCTGDNGACHGINVSLSSPSTGELFVEGLLIKNQDATNAAYTGDGVTVDMNAFANLTLENLRIQGISGCDSGAYPSAHADVVQPYGAANTVIQIDHLTGSTK